MGTADLVLAFLRGLGWPLLFLVGITAAGTVGFAVIEGWTLGDAFYMTVITLSTVGFGEVDTLSPAGRFFTASLIAAGVGTATYLVGAMTFHVTSGDFRRYLWAHRRQQRIDMIENHFIVCGYGRVGRQVAADLGGHGAAVIVIDQTFPPDADTDSEILTVTGDAPDDDVLRGAGIARARGLVAATGDDATNIFIALSARSLNEHLVIVGRANEQSTEPKLIRAGATHVISPYTISGSRIASQLLHPSITDFFDVVMHSGLELWMEEVTVHPDCALDGATIAAAGVRRQTGANIFAVKQRESGGRVTQAEPELILHAGDVLIASGTRTQLLRLAELAGEPREADARVHLEPARGAGDR